MSVSDCTKIEIRIFVLGYYPQGESVLVLIWDDQDKVVLQSALIDCFENKNGNEFLNLFAQYKLDQQKIDFIIWTHPDFDHSKGYKNIIKNLVSEKTVFLIPDGLCKKFRSFWNKDVFLSLFSIFKNKFWKKGNVEHVNASYRRLSPIVYGALSFEDGWNGKIDSEIEILTPIAGLVTSKLENTNSYSCNDISISIIWRIGDKNFFFGGDVENQALLSIDKERLCNINFIKIPHHASQSSNKLVDILSDVRNEYDKKDIISVSTSYAVGRAVLPDLQVLNQYKLLSSSILLTEDSQHINRYGIWYCYFPIHSPKENVLKPIGDASIWHANVPVNYNR